MTLILPPLHAIIITRHYASRCPDAASAAYWLITPSDADDDASQCCRAPLIRRRYLLPLPTLMTLSFAISYRLASPCRHTPLCRLRH